MIDSKIILVGKGPSARKISKSSDYKIACLNNAIILCEEVDYLFINDFETLDLINTSEWNKVKNLIIPTYPHFNFSPNKELPYTAFIKKLPNIPIKYHIHQLDTCLDKDPTIPYLGKSYSVGITAIQWLGINGCKELDFCGIDPEGGYNPIFNISDKKGISPNAPIRAQRGTQVYNTNYQLFTQTASHYGVTIKKI